MADQCMGDISTREKLILTGLYLSKYDFIGLERLGFTSFVEAFNVIGYALGSKPGSIKNYRDEFDPLFPNGRKGWHKRPTRDYCLAVLQQYNDLDLATFSTLIQSFASDTENVLPEDSSLEEQDGTTSFFAQRLITGLAAEHYFESVHAQLQQFKGYQRWLGLFEQIPVILRWRVCLG